MVWIPPPPTYIDNLLYGHPTLHIFIEPLTFDIFLTIFLIYGVNTKTNSWEKPISACLQDYKTTLNSFLYVQHFHMPHQTEIWFEIITVSCIVWI